MNKKGKQLGLSTLIEQIKQDLLSQPVSVDEAMFQVDEVTVELNFVVTGDIESGFDLGVVSLGSKIDESRVQKITVKLMPLVRYAPLTIPVQVETQAAPSPDMLSGVHIETGTQIMGLAGIPPILKKHPKPLLQVIKNKPPVVKIREDAANLKTKRRG